MACGILVLQPRAESMTPAVEAWSPNPWTASESESESQVAQSCPTLCDPMDCSLPGSSVHGIFQARALEWVAISSSRGISPTQGLNLGLPHCRHTLYHLSQDCQWSSPKRPLWERRKLPWLPSPSLCYGCFRTKTVEWVNWFPEIRVRTEMTRLNQREGRGFYWVNGTKDCSHDECCHLAPAAHVTVSSL